MMQWLIGGVAVLALLVGGLVITNQSSEDAMMKDEGAMEKDAMMEKDAIKEGAMEKDSMKEGEAMMEKDAMMTDDAMKKDEMMKDDVMMKDEGAMEKGSYESYAASKLAKANEGDVVLFFRASWCPTCRALDSDIKANATKIPGGVTILDVNYDTETALKQKYGVTYQHTLVQVDASGNLITKWSGGLALGDVLSKIQ
jgi:thiol-disulfide isomerase/thioredoxin